MISKLSIPYIAILDGITMGGGVGISVNGRHRVATENTLFAMPETAIGFFPDVGASYFLPRLPGSLGMYLGLTGARLKGSDCIHAGIATLWEDSETLPMMHAEFGACTSRLQSESSIQNYNTIRWATEDPLPGFSLAPHIDAINECFGAESLEEVFEALKADGTAWSQQTLHTLHRMSPASLKITFRELREGTRLTMEECLRMEYRISQRFMRDTKTDFFEGVRAALVDGDKKPQWAFKSIDSVPLDFVEEFFAPRDAGKGEKELLLGYLGDRDVFRFPQGYSNDEPDHLLRGSERDLAQERWRQSYEARPARPYLETDDEDDDTITDIAAERPRAPRRR